MSVKTIIFDMDDLMINSHPVHMKILEAVVKKYHPAISFRDSLSKEEELKFFGLKISEVLNFLNKKYSLNASLAEMNLQFDKLLLPIFEKQIEVMPGLYNLIKKIKKLHLDLVLASSAKLKKIKFVLEKINLADSFRAIVSGEDEIKHGKPAPDIFLKAAEKINVNPENCLVLEDAKNGVAAAKAAKMNCIGVHNIYLWKKLGVKQDLSQADLEVNSLNEIKIKDLVNPTRQQMP